MTASVSELRELAITIADEAGRFALESRLAGVKVAATKSSLVDVVTEADRATERLVVDRILAARPGDGVLGEEGTSRAGTSGLCWVIDPIDGTSNYLYDIPYWGVSVAVVSGMPDPTAWEILAGAVANPSHGELFSAAQGEGAWRGDRRLRTPDCYSLGEALVATGFSYQAERRAAQGAVVARLLPRVRDIRRMGAASLDLCYVAAGRVNAYFERGLNPWDLAAGALVAREAGAVVGGDVFGTAPGDMLIAASAELFPLLADCLTEIGA